MATVGDVLSRHRVGVSEDRFAALVEQALAELGGPADADPAASLTHDEAAALTAVGADLTPRRRREVDPRAATAADYAALLADALSVTEAAARLGIDGSRVRHRLAQRRLLGIRQSRGWLLPAYQFDAIGGLLPGLDRVAAGVPEGIHPVVLARFFATPQPELVVARRPVSPRQWLQSGGDPDRVLRLVRTLDALA
ncbi:MAG TPA: DNA-binding protein [Mycobacteriales bacterium]|nr:DNA-binding protein [Mycobacteriales bacterium]